MFFRAYAFSLLVIVLLGRSSSGQYQPDWDSLDRRPLPQWFDKAKFGIFIHWGLFSVPAFGGHLNEAAFYWLYLNDPTKPEFREFQQRVYGDRWQYQDFASSFHAELFDPAQWAQIFVNAGAKYVVLTAKHHEGWTNWKSSAAWNWNSVDSGPHRDLVGELGQAVRAVNITFGLYHSLFEFFNPLYLADKASAWNRTAYRDEVALVQMREIINRYKPEILWSDGDWEAPDTYWNSTDFLAWLYNDSPVKETVVTNDRWGSGCICKHGGFYTCSDHYNPSKLQIHKWENCMTIDVTSWGYSRTTPLQQYRSIDELLYQLVSTVACGGNLLLNVGPSGDGQIPLIFQDRLAAMGQWLALNGEAIYDSVPWRVQNETAAGGSQVWYTANPSRNAVYAISLAWPGLAVQSFALQFPISTGNTQVHLLGYASPLAFKPLSSFGGLSIALPNLQDISDPRASHAYIFKLLAVQ